MSAQGWLALLVVAAAAVGLAWRLFPRSGSPGCGCGEDACTSKKKKGR